MDDKIRTILEEMPDKSRSKLEPHADLIRELRRKGRTYEDIARFFAVRLNLKVAPSTIYAFVRVRARRRERSPIELPSARASKRRSYLAHLPLDQSDIEIRQRIEELKRRQPPQKPEMPRFEYDENQRLELIRRPKHEEG